jgi:hypothetical protein
MRKSIVGLIVSVMLWSNLSLASTLPEAPQQFATFSECHLTSGQVIAPCHIGYRTYGTLNDDKSNVLLVPTWFTGTSADYAYLISRFAQSRRVLHRHCGCTGQRRVNFTLKQ